MPDTGAPWNIPYVAGTDLVSDWPTDSLALANAIASGLDAAETAGIGTNVVSTALTGSFSTTSTSFTDWTSMTLSFTPTSATSKVLLMFTAPRVTNSVATNQLFAILNRDGSDIFVESLISNDGNPQQGVQAITYVDSPATTSAVTYKVRVRVNGATGTWYGGTLTAIEVAA